ncbi:multidrug effflux MFS transporter (plasmid) [Legionella sp. D16C41]|uniref:multidrug effflux MFS transporter n=1 Tax=Legionella sp. D16C41 TaxID=3402688 RepID=UPI003AF859A8
MKNDQSISIVVIILLVATLGQVASDLYLPSLPSIAIKLNINTSWIQMTLAIYMAGYSLSQLIYGPLSDAIGRRIPLIIGLSIAFIGGMVCYLSLEIHYLLIGRFLQGLGAGAGTSLARPILRDLFEKEKLAVYNSYLAISSVFILSAAPVLGGYIEQFLGWRYNFLFLSLYSFITLCFFYAKVSETNQHHCRDNLKLSKIINNIGCLFKSPVFLKFSLCLVLTYAGILAWLTAAPIVLQEKVGLTPVQFGWIYIFSGLGFALGGIINANYVTKFGINTMINFGFLCQFSAGLLMLLFYLLGYMNVYVIVTPIAIFMCGSSLVYPNSSAGALTPFPKIAETAGAIFGFMQILGGALSSSTIALVHHKSQLPIAIAFLITSLISILIFYILSMKKPTN